MHLRSLLLVAFAFSFLVPNSFAAETDSDIRYQMLLSARIDGYPTDDDVIAISRYLTAVGDRQMDVPDAIAAWIQDRIGQLGPSATPRLINAYMHYLRNGAVAPPFDGGAPGSARNRLLLAIARALASRGTPVANLALLMFTESNDLAQRHIQATADYSSLRSFYWAIGHADWMDWARVGLRPDTFDGVFTHSTSWRSPEFPVVTDLAKTGVLRNVRAFLAGVDVRPPVSASNMNFIDFTDSSSYSWGHLGHSRSPAPDPSQLVTQGSALATLFARRYASTVGLSPVADNSVSHEVSDRYSLGSSLVVPEQFTEFYGSALGFPEFHIDDRLERLSNVLYSQQFRLLALSALALAEYQRGHNQGGRDIPMDAVFSQLAATTIPVAESKTAIVTNLDPVDLQAAADDDAAFLQCNPKSASVVRRQISIHDARFIEVLDAECMAGSTMRLTKSGPLSTDFARLLEVNASSLDMLKISLTLHVLKSGNSAGVENPEDVNIVRVKPQLAAALIVASLAHPDMPWQFIRDVLLQDWPPALEWFVPGWRPTSSVPEDARSLQTVSLENTEFQTRQTAVFLRQMNYLQFETEWHFYHGVAPTVNAMKAVENNCGNFVFDFLSFGGCCGGCTNTGKKTLVEKLNQLADQANKVGENSESLLDNNCVAARDHAPPPPGQWWGDSRLIAINFDTQQFATLYITHLCDFPVGGGIYKLAKPVQDLLKRALKQDPIFLNRYQLDIVGSYDGWDNDLLSALKYAGEEAPVAQQVMSFLQANDLIYELPSIPIPTPPISWFDFRNWKPLSVLYLSNPVEAMTAPLMRTQEGMALAQDLAALQRLSSFLPTPPEAKRHRISDSFMAAVRSAEQSTLASQNQAVDVQVSDFNSKVHGPQNNFTVGFSLSMGAGTVPGLFFQYNGVGINAALPLPNVVLVAPVLNEWQIPKTLMFSSTTAAPLPISLPNIPNPGEIGRSAAAGLPAAAALGDQPGFDLHISFPTLDWGSLLSQSNFVGRSWLMNEVSAATPTLTQDQITQITAALQRPTFPLDLANLVAVKAEQASASNFQASMNSLLLNQSAAEICKGGSWSNCGVAIKEALDKHPSTAAGIAGLAALWGQAYDAQYDSLRKQGRLERSTPDSEKFYEAVKSKIDPLDIAKDHAEDAALKWVFGLAKIGFVLEWVRLPAVEVLKQSFKSSDTASDYDELQLADDIIQQEIALQLAPFLKSDWNSRLSTAVDQATPQWKVP
jgi:hypothetical protein